MLLVRFGRPGMPMRRLGIRAVELEESFIIWRYFEQHEYYLLCWLDFSGLVRIVYGLRHLARMGHIREGIG